LPLFNTRLEQGCREKGGRQNTLDSCIDREKNIHIYRREREQTRGMRVERYRYNNMQKEKKHQL
jgi:hypothetical protein